MRHTQIARCDDSTSSALHTFTRLGQFLLLLTVLGCWTVEAANAQPPSVGTPAVTTPAPVTSESIESLRKQAAESPDLDAEAKQKIEATCTLAQEGLKRVADLIRQAEQFKGDAESVQQRVESLREQLAELQKTEPSAPTDLTLPELEQEVSRREVQLAELKAARAKSETEPSTRANRRRDIRPLLLSAAQRVVDIQKQLDTPAPAEEPALVTAARRLELQVRRMLIEAELPALQNELSKYDAEDAADVLRLERDVRMQEIAIATAELDTLQALLSKRRAADSAAALLRARDALIAVPNKLRDYAEENLKLAEDAHAVGEPIDESRRKLEKIKSRLEEIQKQFTATQQRVDEIGLTGSVGALLRRQRIDLPNLTRRKSNVHDRKTTIEDAQYDLFEYDEGRSESIDSLMTQLMANISPIIEDNRQKLEESALILIEQRREYLDGAIRNYNTYLDTLFELDATEQRLIRVTQRYKNYIDERVLWIRSNRMLLSSLEVDEPDTWILDSSRWIEIYLNLEQDINSHGVLYAVAVFLLALLLWQKSKFRSELEVVSRAAARGTCTDIRPTLRAIFLTFMLSVTWPGILSFVAWRLNVASNGSDFSRAVAQALFAIAWVYFPLDLMRRICKKVGLADSHFAWSPTTLRVFRRNLQWASLLGLPVVFLCTLLYASAPEHGVDAVERICFLVGMLILAVFLRRLLLPKAGIFSKYLAEHPGSWFDRLRYLWYGGSILVPVLLGGMTLLGYYYTAQQLIWRFFASAVFVTLVLILRGLLQRLLLVHRKKISIQQARERRAAESAAREQAGDAASLTPALIVPTEEAQADIAANAEQSQRLIRVALLAVSLVGLWLIWVDVLPALRLLDEWPVWTTKVTAIPETVTTNGTMSPLTPSAGSDSPATAGHAVEMLKTVTVADIGLAILIAIVTIVCARNVPGLMEISILQRLPLDHSIRYAITSVTSYVIILFGVILAFNAISVGWSKVQWLATALTFGLAFGLQEIFANFVAGLILLFERPLRVGDVVTVDEISGVVSRIRIRATTITNWDRKEYVIPNKEFITGRMLNWTLSDKTNRIVINVGIAYGSNVELAKELLLKTCSGHPLTMTDPPTVVTFEGFGDNSLNLVVRTYLPDLDNRLRVIDELHTNIDRAFREANIEISFPQRDLHLRSIDPAVADGLRGEKPA